MCVCFFGCTALRDSLMNAHTEFPQNIYRSDMLPLSVRVPRQQHNRLKQRRKIDGITVQEHVRRAIDHYLGVLDTGAQPMLPSYSVPSSRQEGGAQPAELGNPGHASMAAGVSKPAGARSASSTGAPGPNVRKSRSKTSQPAAAKVRKR